MPALCTRRGEKRWRAKVIVNGKTRTKWFGPGKEGGKEYRKAVIWEEQTRAELLEETERQAQEMEEMTPTVSLTIREWANAYLEMVHRRRSKATVTEAKTAFKNLGKYLGPDMKVEKITKPLAMKHLNTQCDERSGSAANNDRKNLSTAWSWGCDFLDGFPQSSINPFRAVPPYRVDKKDRYVPPEEDFWKVMEVVGGQDRIMLLAFLHLGARRGEIFRLRWEDVDFVADRVRLGTRKTKDGNMKYDWLPMTEELKGELLWWWENRKHKHSEFVFTVGGDGSCVTQYDGKPYKERLHFMKTACARAGVKPFGFHAIRHLTAVILYQAGKPLSMIQAILRHEKATTTEVYLRRLGYEPDRLREAINVFENRGPAKVIRMEDHKKTPDLALVGS